MKAVKVLACCALVFPLVGTVPVPPARLKTITPPANTGDAVRAPARALLREGTELFRAGRYSDALETFKRMRDAARAAGIGNLAARAMGNIGGCEFALHRYQAALTSFLDAVRAAKRAGDTSAAAVFNVNIASLYSEMGDLDAAAEWTEAGLRRLSEQDRRDNEAKFLIQLASLRARQERMAEAVALFSQGLDAADRAGDRETCANGWNRLGEEYLKQHRLAEAEPALLEAYRIRRLNHLALDTSYRNLGILRLEQGDLEAAGQLLDRAVELAARPQGPVPTWDMYHQRGRVRLAQGRLAEALEDLRIARRLARGWRWSSPAADGARVGAEGWIERVHAALVEAGNRLYLQNHDPALIGETFEAAEENRGSSLRSLLALSSAGAPGLPAVYWEALARLQRAEIAALRAPGPDTQADAAAARAALARLELENPEAAPAIGPGLLARARAGLPADSVLFSFHCGESSSWLWALDRDGLTLYRLPRYEELREKVEGFSAAVRADAPEADGAARELYRTLFGAVDAHFLRRTLWLVALDRGLLEAPLAALRDPQGYLVERHQVETIPGVGAWLDSAGRPRNAGSRLFVGVGDAVYNTADPRLEDHPAPASGALLLPRLVASGAEVDACARLWPGERALLKGPEATRENLLRLLSRNPAVVHLAAHVLESSGSRPQGLIALSLTPRRESELLSPQEIAAWRASAGLVVLSGCHSAGAPALPGTGLLGLTRAWLAGGARTVIASAWATPDESGALFGALYRNLDPNHDFAASAALRSAQLEMIHSPDWRSRPRYWGAYFAVGTR